MELFGSRESSYWEPKLISSLTCRERRFGVCPVEPTRMEWCRGPDLNRRHMDFQSIALPTELPRHDCSGPLRREGDSLPRTAGKTNNHRIRCGALRQASETPHLSNSPVMKSPNFRETTYSAMSFHRRNAASWSVESNPSAV